MNLFCRKYPSCETCGVLFEPRKDAYPTLCATHAKPFIEKDQRCASVVGWARVNWERLEEQMQKERAEQQAAYNLTQQAMFQSMSKAQEALRPQNLGQAGGMFSPFGRGY